jgi:Sec-independent protein translocase protein TatA
MFARAESFTMIIIIAMVTFGHRRIPEALRNLRKSRQILKSEARALREDVPLPAERVIVAEPGDVVQSAHRPGTNKQQ